ncbi:SAE2-domain-containing protein [Annulohypoxylon maeteangense]|uniref:SAE2-domain-containing protein n=1 Tax=Annulohypoxylon maeteangense TaxID=1927788 RepID=UPI002008D78E|nr:SAE2-domain-containing protein [Annulohypoxylon maeteangense]KAI0881794.1 SAE2-domain-containing protein [Annulohypoxylon maeteangense]
MENWFKEVGRPALFDALAGACDQINEVLDAGLVSRISENTRLSTELEQLRSQVSDANQLREENQSLQRQIRALKDGGFTETSFLNQPKHRDGSNNLRIPLAPKSVNQVSNPRRSVESGKNKLDELEFSELREEHLKLEGSYTKLRGKYSELEDAHAKLNRRLRDMTKAYNQWMGHANQLNELCQKRSRTIKKLEAQLNDATAQTSVPFHASFSSNGSIPPERRQPTTTSELIRPGSIPRESPLLWPPTDENSSHESLRSTVSASPELAKIANRLRSDPVRDATPRSKGHICTQVGEETSLPPLPYDKGVTMDGVLIKHEPSSDAPVIVSERCLRKRKHDDDQTGERRAVVKVKAEEDSSGPQIVNEHRRFVPHESIDFDAEGGRVDTPRKRNRTNSEFEDMSGLNNARSHTNNTRLDGGHGLVQDTPTRGSCSTLPQLDENPKTAHVQNTAAQNSSGLQNDPSPALKFLGRSTMSRQGLKVNILAERNEPSSALCNGISSLLEDGDDYGAPRISTKIPKTGRLRGLLDNPTPRHETITPTKSALPNQANISSILESQIPPRRELPFGKNGLTPFEKRTTKTTGPLVTPETTSSRRVSTSAITKQSSNRHSERRSTDGVASDATPLRKRPKSQLGIGDFKINPNANEGYNFAFTDVVRNKNERANLAGCVQEGCCGQTFRLQARAQRGQTSAPDFQTSLEKYLGDDAWKLSTMTKPEKEELWLEAKTQELANEHGKHRHRFHRAASPVGFWRTDFPSTQEEQRDKEEAAKVARQTIDERYREAMRPGGRWLFRDE